MVKKARDLAAVTNGRPFMTGLITRYNFERVDRPVETADREVRELAKNIVIG
jgi:hypothetical protein